MDAMASKSLRELVKRQNVGPYDNPNDDDWGGPDGESGSWWWTSTGLAVRYTIVIVVFALLLLYFVGGYWHAKRRVRKGLPLLAYHRWMVNRRPLFNQQQQYYQASPDYHPPGGPYAAGGGGPLPETYPMYGYYRPPPPAYNRGEGPPPVYQAPEGASKIMAEQGYTPASQQQDQHHNQVSTGFDSGAQGSSSVVAPEATASGARQ